MRLDGKLALITGAARGIGEAIAAAMATEGAQVLLADQDGAGAQAAAARIGSRARGLQLDVTDLAAAEALAASLPALAILVNSAGIIRQGKVTDADAAQVFARTLAINAGGTFNLCRACHSALKANGGNVINLASIRSFAAAANAAAYAASKGAVLQLTRALAVEWAPDGIRVNALAPGFIDTPLIPDAERTAERAAYIAARTPMKRTAGPEEVAGAAVFLASDEARYVTGSILPVDGGFLAG